MRGQAMFSHRILLFILAASIFISCPVLATTLKDMTVTCPVCTTAIDYKAIMTTNNFGGQDRDFLTLAAGYQPLLYYPITCPHCYYSGFANDFAAGVNLSQEVRDKILKEKVLCPAAPITDPKKIPAWVRYDLISQMLTLKGVTIDVQAYNHLRTGWAVRLEFDPSATLSRSFLKRFDSLLSERMKGFELGKGNRALFEVQVGHALLQEASALAGTQQSDYCCAALILLRSHGENAEVLKTVADLKTILAGEEFAGFAAALQASIIRERTYQAKAAALYETYIKDPEAQDRAIYAYLCGELYRRLGQADPAKRFYDLAESLPGNPDWLQQYIQEQRALL